MFVQCVFKIKRTQKEMKTKTQGQDYNYSHFIFVVYVCIYFLSFRFPVEKNEISQTKKYN